MENSYFVGIDGGGTKSTLSLLDINGNVVLKAFGGTTNLASSDIDIVSNSINSLFKEVFNFKHSINIASVCIGTAGISVQGAKEKIYEIIKSESNCNNIFVLSDMDILLNCHKDENRIFLISGTGSICYACNSENEKYRFGGYGHIFSDLGSGYDIACKIFKSIMAEHDGFGKKTILTKLFMEQENISQPLELISIVYKKPFEKKYIADFGKLLQEALAYNDEVAFEICDEVATSLYNYIKYAYTKLNTKDEIKLVLSGSVLKKNKVIYDILIKKIHSNFENIVISDVEIVPDILACELGKVMYERYRSNN